MDQQVPMKLYLAGPMTGIAEFNFPAFHAAASLLRAHGHEVWSPAEKDEANGFDPATDEALPLREYMKDDLPAVLNSDAVAVLPGWEKSRGANLEVHVARACGIPVLEAATLEPPSETILQEAQRLVHGDRQASYGHPIDDFTRTGKLWSAILGHEVGPRQVALCMVAVKISREVNAPKRDNRVDGAGYFATLDMVDERLS